MDAALIRAQLLYSLIQSFTRSIPVLLTSYRIMKRSYPLLIFILAILSLLSGKLTSGISLFGRLGVNVFYKEYKFFKIWWQAALVYFALMMAVFIILYFIDGALRGVARKAALLLFFFLFLSGLYFTFRDFRTDLSHRWLGERFHLGVYLYWIGFSVISLFFLATQRTLKH